MYAKTDDFMLLLMKELELTNFDTTYDYVQVLREEERLYKQQKLHALAHEQFKYYFGAALTLGTVFLGSMLWNGKN